ncbi:MAG: amidohydrolase family protein [Verrucomicrobia bacterium]|nr:amidohydrolase family protein [Verrucomicrobiota bacterium]
MIIRAPVIVTMEGELMRDGLVRVERDRIVEVTTSNIGNSSDVLSLDNHVLLPGLINAHCHLDYTCLRGKIAPRESFTDWIRAINAEKAQLGENEYAESIQQGLKEARRFGTTAIVNLEAFPELITRIQPVPLRIWWCSELIDVSAPGETEQRVSNAVHRLQRRAAGLAPHALFTASAELFRRCAEIACANRWLLTTHLAESREEMQMFRDAAGPLFDFLRAFGRDASDCGGTTPLARFLHICPGIAQKDTTWLIAHLNELTERDFELLRNLPEKFSIAHCPRSHVYFRHSPFPFERLHALGFNICLGTDSLASNMDLSLFAEMRQFRQSHPQLSAAEILGMVTVNPASVLRRKSDLGKIAPGFLADMIALPLNGSADIYEQITGFEGHVPWMMINGVEAAVPSRTG